MGILAKFYGNFAAYLSQAGATVLTYDYRGIGASRPVRLRGFDASVEQWGSMDCAAGIAWLKRHFRDARVCVIGHSIGAFLTGFAPNNHQIDKYVTICGHSAYWRDYKPQVRIQMYLLWHMFMPAITRVLGYFPGSRLGILENLPRGVALEWANRKHPDFYWNLRDSSGRLDQRRIHRLLAHFAAMKAPILAYSFTDDPFATVPATERLLSNFPNSSATHLRYSPQELNQEGVGHFAFFSRRFQHVLWPEVRDWVVNNVHPSRPALSQNRV